MVLKSHFYWISLDFDATFIFLSLSPNLSHLVKGVGWGSYLCSYTLNFWPGMLLERNAIQNAENIFSSHQQTAKGTSVSGSAGQQLLLSRCELSIALICCSVPSAQLKTCIQMIPSHTWRTWRTGSFSQEMRNGYVKKQRLATWFSNRTLITTLF